MNNISIFSFHNANIMEAAVQSIKKQFKYKSFLTNYYCKHCNKNHIAISFYKNDKLKSKLHLKHTTHCTVLEPEQLYLIPTT